MPPARRTLAFATFGVTTVIFASLLGQPPAQAMYHAAGKDQAKPTLKRKNSADRKNKRLNQGSTGGPVNEVAYIWNSMTVTRGQATFEAAFNALAKEMGGGQPLAHGQKGRGLMAAYRDVHGQPEYALFHVEADLRPGAKRPGYWAVPLSVYGDNGQPFPLTRTGHGLERLKELNEHYSSATWSADLSVLTRLEEQLVDHATANRGSGRDAASDSDQMDTDD